MSVAGAPGSGYDPVANREAATRPTRNVATKPMPAKSRGSGLVLMAITVPLSAARVVGAPAAPSRPAIPPREQARSRPPSDARNGGSGQHRGHGRNQHPRPGGLAARRGEDL